MKLKKLTALALTLMMVFAVFGVSFAPAARAAGGYNWVSVWGSSLVNGSVSVSQLSLQDVIPAGSTLRIRLTVTKGGEALKFVFSNQYGAAPITIDALSVARASATDAAGIVDGTQTPITFNKGETFVTLPVGEHITSDLVDFPTSEMEEISVSIYFRNFTYMTSSGLSNGRTFMQPGGVINGTMSAINNTALRNPGEINITSSTVTYHTIPFLERIDSRSPEQSECAVFIGDSTLVNDTYLYYARRIHAAGVHNVAVINEAIIGNKLLSNGSGLIGNLYGQAMVDRFRRDVLSIPGVKYCFVKIGLNDVLHQFSKSLGGVTPHYTAQQIIEGYRSLISLCHAKGIKIYFFTKSPWKGYQRSFLGQTGDVSWTQEMQNMCDELTTWIKTNKEADGFIDCSPLANPADPYALCPSFTPDGAHLTTIGSIAMADLIPLSFVGVSGGPTAAALLGVNPYAEKYDIIRHMNEPVTQAPTPVNPTPVNPTPATPVNPTPATPVNPTPANPNTPTLPNAPATPVTPTTPTTPYTPTTPGSTSNIPTKPYSPASSATPGGSNPSSSAVPGATTPAVNGTTNAAVPGSATPAVPNAATPTSPALPYEAPAAVPNADPAVPNQEVRYDVQDDAAAAPVGSVGNPGTVLFILLLITTLMGVSVVVFLTISKKKA